MNKNFFVSTNHQKKSQFLASFWRPQFFMLRPQFFPLQKQVNMYCVPSFQRPQFSFCCSANIYYSR